MNESDPNYALFSLTTNITAAAMVREDEERLAAAKTPLVDLRSIPRERWPEFYNREVTVPPEIQKYLDGRESGPMTKDDVQGMEIAVERHHGVTPPFYVTMGPHLQARGRAWCFVPEVAPYVSGFEFGNTDA